MRSRDRWVDQRFELQFLLLQLFFVPGLLQLVLSIFQYDVLILAEFALHFIHGGYLAPPLADCALLTLKNLKKRFKQW